MRIHSIFLLCLFVPACSFFGGFDEESAPPAYPAEMVSGLTSTPDFGEPPIRTLHAQRFDVLHFGDLDDMQEFALVSQPDNRLVAFGLDGDEGDPAIVALYDYLLDKCRQVSMKSVGDQNVTLNTVRCGDDFVAGLEKVSDGSIAITFLDNLDDHQRVSVLLNEMNRRAQGITGPRLRVSVSMDWAAENSVPLQPGAASIPAPDGRVWFGIDYLVENTSDVEASFHPAKVTVVDRQGESWTADADATARSNAGLDELVLPAGQKARTRTLVAVPPDVARLGFRIHLEDLGESGWFVGYRTVNHVSDTPETEASSSTNQPGSMDSPAEGTEADSSNEGASPEPTEAASPDREAAESEEADARPEGQPPEQN